MVGRSDEIERTDDGAHERPSRPAMPRKTAQLCKQVQRAIEMALLGECEDEVVQSLTVAEVLPAPDDRRLVVWLLVGPEEAELGREEVARRLELEKPVLVAAVVAEINRRKCPDLRWELVKG